MAGFGATVLGYAHPEVDAAASEAQARCEMIPTVHFSFPSPLFSCQGNVHRVDGVAAARKDHANPQARHQMNAHAQVRPNHHRSNGILCFAKRKGGVVETRCCLEHLRQERLGHYDRSRTRSTRRYREANDPTGHRRCTRTARPIIDGVPRGYFAMVGWCCGRPRCRIIRVRSPKNRADSYVQ